MLLRIALLSLLTSALAAVSTAADGEPKPPSLKAARAAYDKADAALNTVWAEVKKVLPEDDFAALKEDQKAWLAHRDLLALSPYYSGAPEDDEDAKKSPEFFSTAATLMDERALWLRGLITNASGDSLTGEWEDSRGGHMEIVEQDGKLHFTIETVRGPSANLGQIAGIATWNAPIGWFSDKGRDKDKTDETNLAFHWQGRKLEVIGANTEHYHGKRAWFDGGYVKVGTLDKKQEARVLQSAKAGAIPEE